MKRTNERRCAFLGGWLALAPMGGFETSSATKVLPNPGDAAPAEDATVTSASDAAAVFTSRPYVVNQPPGYDPKTPTPLVVMLHGFGTDGPGEEAYLRLTSTSNAHDFLYAYPDGSFSENGPVMYRGQRFWNATNACCDFSDPPDARPDDVAYLNAVLDEILSNYNVDKKRIFLIGHSNGGFMAHRMACDAADRIAAIVSFAGAQWLDPADCKPSAPVAVVELHGDADLRYDPKTMLWGIPYDGGSTPEGTFPSAPTTVQTWANKNGCSGPILETDQSYDLVPDLPAIANADASPYAAAPASDASADGGEPLDGEASVDATPDAPSPNETRVAKYACKGSIDTELWTIKGGGHMPPLNTSTLGEAVWAFFRAHPKP